MKKTLIAAAALFAAAGAMADVTVFGTIDSTLRMSDNGTAKKTGVGRDGSGTTGLYLRVSEDLGDGLKAIGLYEHDFNFTGGTGADQGSSSADGTGERYVGLQGGFGSIKLGAPNQPSLTIQSGLRGAPFGTKDGGRQNAGGVYASGSGTGTGTPSLAMFGTNLTRQPGSIVYETPNFSGFSAQLMYVPASEDDAGTETASKTDIGAFYKAGPINAGVAVYSLSENKSTGAVEEQLTHLGFQYNLGFATLGVGYHVYTKDGEDFNSGSNFQAIVPLSEQLTLGVNYQMLTDDADVKTTGDVNQIAVGVNYALSKNTSIYARYISTEGDDWNNGDGVTTTLAGLRVNY
ncbi:porin [Hylemonella sp. W303a]|uniref:porin n=1 Tax=Hylemonella sp. W303a TaxID=3389873 RepID=UPI00396B21D3